MFVAAASNDALLQVPFYLAELTEKIAQDDRVQILKVSQAKLKVNTNPYPTHSSKYACIHSITALECILCPICYIVCL